MAGVPRTSVDDGFVNGLSCAVCGRPDLYVQHLPNYPDFVTCRHCGAAFVVEDAGERVMYGKIPDGYPDTSSFALRQWVWLEAVARRAAAERPAPAGLPAAESALRSTMVEEPEAEIEPEAEEQPAADESAPSPDWLAARLMTSGMPAGVPIPTEPDPYRPTSQGVPLTSDTGPTDESLPAWLRGPAPAAAARAVEPSPLPVKPPSKLPSAAVVPVAAAAAAAASGSGSGEEPSQDERHRVVIRGDRIRMPITACAHCQKSPAPERLGIAGSLPRADAAGRRKTSFAVPLCEDCHRRSVTPSSEQRNSRIMAVLVGALAGLVLVVAMLAFGIIPFGAQPLLGLLLLGGSGSAVSS